MGYEDRLIRNIDRKRVSSIETGTIEKAYKKAEAMLHDPDYAIQMDSFTDLYHEGVAADKRRVELKRATHKFSETKESTEMKRVADIFEAIMLEQSELSEWLGSNVAVIKTTEYDDFVNGVDLIADWKSKTGGESHTLALAVDVTFGAGSVEKKMRRNKENIDKNQLGKIKYFRAGDGTMRGERSAVPHVVIGAGKRTVEELAKLWTSGEKKKLGSHPIQRILVEEIWFQMKAIHSYAKARGLKRVEEAYGRSLAIVGKLMEEKGSVELGHMESDPVYDEITSVSQRMFHT